MDYKKQTVDFPFNIDCLRFEEFSRAVTLSGLLRFIFYGSTVTFERPVSASSFVLATVFKGSFKSENSSNLPCL